MRWYIAVVLSLAAATPAAAQSTYVGASLVGDIVRFSKVEVDAGATRLADATLPDGESLGFNVRVGRELGDRWGVEFEFARTGEFDQQTVHRVFPAGEVITVPGRPGILPIPGLPNLPGLPGLPGLLPIPDIEFTIEGEQRHTSLGALLFHRQRLSDRVNLSYLGGVVFNRIDTELDYDLTDPRLALWRTIVPDQTSVDYGVGAAAGIEAGIGLTDAVALTTGVRLQSIGGASRGGWRIRPNVGVRVAF